MTSTCARRTAGNRDTPALIAFTVVIVMDIPETQQQRERGRVTVLGRRTDSGERCTLLAIHEIDGAWSFQGLGAPVVTLSKADTVALPRRSWSVHGEPCAEVGSISAGLAQSSYQRT
jgi:hypothetical protein